MVRFQSIEESIEAYCTDHRVEELVQEILEAIVANRPDNVPRFVVELLIERYGAQEQKVTPSESYPAMIQPEAFSRTDPGTFLIRASCALSDQPCCRYAVVTGAYGAW